MKAVILAGGFGKRLRPLTNDKPKSLIEVKGRPILETQLRWLKNYGINEVILCLGFLKEKIIEYLGNGSKFGVKVGYVIEDEPLGTGGAILNAEPFLKKEEYFFALNGDIITNLNPMELLNNLPGYVGVIALVPLRSPYGVVDLDNEGHVYRFREKPILSEYWINAGVYCLTPAIFNYLEKGGGIEFTAFPKLAAEGKLKAVKYFNCFWKSIDVYKDIEEAEKEWPE